MKKSKQSSNEILAGGNIRRLFTAPMIICLVLFVLFVFSSVFMGYSAYDYDSYGLINILKNEAAEFAKNVNYSPSYYLSSGISTTTLVAWFGVLFSVLQFSFLLDKKQCYTQLSFAVGRRQLFTDKIFFPIIIAFSITVFIKILAVMLNIKYLGFTPNLLLGFIVNTLVTFKEFVIGYTIGLVAHLLASRRAEVYFLIFTIYEIPTAISAVTNSIFAGTLYGYPSYPDTFSVNVFSSQAFLSDGTPVSFDNFSVSGKIDFGVGFTNTIFSVALCLIAILICKAYFVNKFKAENCGVRGRSSFALILSCLVIPISAIHTTSYMGEFFGETGLNFTISFLIALVLTFIAAVLICLAVTWSTQKIKTGLIAGGIGVALQLLIVIIGVTGCFGYDSALPDLQEIKSVQISVPFAEMYPDGEVNDFFDLSDDEYFYGGESINLIEPDEIAVALNVHKTAISNREQETASTCQITYTMKDGSTTSRLYENISKATVEEALKLWKTQDIEDRLAVLLNQIPLKDLIKMRQAEGYPHLVEWQNPLTSSSVVYPDEEEFDDYEFLYPSPIVDFTAICFISKDYNATNYTSIEPDTRSEKYKKFNRELQSAIYKDALNLSAVEWFRPEEQLGVIAFEDNGGFNEEKNTTLRYGYVFYLNSNMKNTLRVLEKHDLMKCFGNTREIEKAHLVDIKEVAQWINEGEDIHNIYFSQNSYSINYYLSEACGYVDEYDGDWYEEGWYDDDYPFFNISSLLGNTDDKKEIPVPVQTELTDKDEIRRLVEESYMAYAVGDKGKFLVVKYSDECCTMLVLPE